MEHIREWSEKQKECLSDFRQINDCKRRLEELEKQEREQTLLRRIGDQKRINEEQAKFQLQQQKEKEDAMIRQHRAEEEWQVKKLNLPRVTAELGVAVDNIRPNNTQQTVKLQKYTILSLFWRLQRLVPVLEPVAGGCR